MDEFVVGMIDYEIEFMAKLLRDISGEYLVVVVEYDMEFIKVLDCFVMVLYEGYVLVEGILE